MKSSGFNNKQLKEKAIELSFDLREILQNGNMVYVAGIEENGDNKFTKYITLPEIYDENYNTNEKILNQFLINKVKKLEYYVNDYTLNQKKQFVNTIENLKTGDNYPNTDLEKVCENFKKLVRGHKTHLKKEDILNLMNFLKTVKFDSSLVASNINLIDNPIILSHSLNRPSQISEIYRLGMLLEDMLFDGTDLFIWYHKDCNDNSKIYAFVFFLDTRKIKHFDDELMFIENVFEKRLKNYSCALPEFLEAKT
jgi:hypothetical protein